MKTEEPDDQTSRVADGCVATFKKKQESEGSGRPGAGARSHLEQLVDELNLSPNIRTAHPPRVVEGKTGPTSACQNGSPSRSLSLDVCKT